MSDPPAATKRRFRLWITLSELVGVLALVIAGLNFWDSHRERREDAHRDAAAQRLDQGRSALILTAQMVGDGARLDLQPLNGAQALQDERFVFPRAILDHPMEVSAARPQIDVDWIAAGLRAHVVQARRAGTAASDGEAVVPVGVAATFVQDGAVRTDRSLYEVGYAWRSRLFGGPRLALQGVSLLHRDMTGDLSRAVEAAWTRER